MLTQAALCAHPSVPHHALFRNGGGFHPNSPENQAAYPPNAPGFEPPRGGTKCGNGPGSWHADLVKRPGLTKKGIQKLPLFAIKGGFLTNIRDWGWVFFTRSQAPAWERRFPAKLRFASLGPPGPVRSRHSVCAPSGSPVRFLHMGLGEGVRAGGAGVPACGSPLPPPPRT